MINLCKINAQREMIAKEKPIRKDLERKMKRDSAARTSGMAKILNINRSCTATMAMMIYIVLSILNIDIIIKTM